MNGEPFTGRCLCGAIRFRIDALPDWVAICHCESCRRVTGSALMTGAGFPRGAVAFEGQDRRFYESSPGVKRGFCPTCGTSIAYENALWPDDIHFMTAIFDRPERIRPQFEIFTADRLPWIRLTDGLPTYAGTRDAW